MTWMNRAGMLLLGSLGLGGVVGCANAPEDDALETERKLGYSRGGGWGCPDCGFKNSPHFGLHPINDFHLGSGFGGVGYALADIEDPSGIRHPVDFDGSALVAQTPGGDVSGSGLLGWRLVFEANGGETRVAIMGFEVHPDWVGGGSIPTYGLAAETGPQGETTLENVCPGLSSEMTNIVFTPGETYDPVGLVVDSNQSDRVTIACRGHAVAKLKFLGHDPGDAYGSTVEGRQAALKMLTADYCGDGNAYTTVGHPLAFEDDLGLFHPHWYAPAGDLEAQWTEDGAVCLNDPRNAAFLRSDVACADMLPMCSVPGLGGALWSSYAPKHP